MNQKIFGYNVKYHRLRKGMTQGELGEKMGVSQVTIANYERGTRFPKEHLLKALGEQLSISLDELFYNENHETAETDVDYGIEDFLHILLSENLERAWDYLTRWKMKFLLTSEKIFSDIFVPLLKLLGDWWFQNRIIISQEHLVSEKIKILIIRLVQDEMKTANTVSDKNKRWLGLCAPSEQHELVIFMASQIMRLKGWEVYYLGRDVPLSDLIFMLHKVNPHVLVLSITMVDHRNGLEAYLKDLINHEEIRVIVGGKGINESHCRSLSPKITYARNLKETIRYSLNYIDKEDKYE